MPVHVIKSEFHFSCDVFLKTKRFKTLLLSLRSFSLLSRTLIAACTDNDVNAVRRLLVEGNNLNDTDDGDSLLSLACSAGYYELAQVLLAMSAQVEDRGQKNDCTPLMEAASAGHVEIIELLIRHGADVNAQSSTGNTPLMYACAGGHVEAVKVLLAHGANVEDHNENGHTPLMESASAGHVEVAKVNSTLAFNALSIQMIIKRNVELSSLMIYICDIFRDSSNGK